MADDFNEPLSPMGQAAAGLHELYKALCGAGFTKQEALSIVAISMANAKTDDDTP